MRNRVFWKTVNIRLNPSFLHKFDFSCSNSSLLTKVDWLNSTFFNTLASAGWTQPFAKKSSSAGWSQHFSKFLHPILSIFLIFVAFQLQPAQIDFFSTSGQAEVQKWKKIVCFWGNSVQTLTYCEWRATAPVLTPIRLPHTQVQCKKLAKFQAAIFIFQFWCAGMLL